MVLEIGLLAESPMADVALEGPGARVHVRVRLEIAGGGEGFGAHCAFVRLLLQNKGVLVSNHWCGIGTSL